MQIPKWIIIVLGHDPSLHDDLGELLKEVVELKQNKLQFCVYEVGDCMADFT